ncbi:velvet factor [Gorgonomyces haynaldii]|nr:velvet factor [Gorgonomyces haynaldii]
MFLVCVVSLVSVEKARIMTDGDGNDKNKRLRASNNLLGNAVSNCHHLNDVNGKSGMYFYFPDLGIRSPGIYKFRCSLIELDMGSGPMPIHCSVETEPLRIVSPKNYSGPVPPTDLALAFVQQGADFRLR